ncbi:Uncharacterised protein [BD1-7 clade bacterium]|uniref:Uncharacterized protein n=1 Tax=BD1-7 clade bacterium TaxID=2029982 RepID=A0A5S9N0I3_9GAMM|nr:Uncharacterised protein [BD1-7 clade bacterium]CAA0082969.1 Uncharacterised protein [BD1-7 clade bacterium]CAA0116788.1 Uncharacterised protein [BD1-7 clade bacterium]
MSDDLAFTIQLGLILPKFDATIKEDLLTIARELTTTVESGSADGGPANLDEIKSLLLQDLEVFLDRTIMPQLHSEQAPAEDTEADEEVEAEAAEE